MSRWERAAALAQRTFSFCSTAISVRSCVSRASARPYRTASRRLEMILTQRTCERERERGANRQAHQRLLGRVSVRTVGAANFPSQPQHKRKPGLS